MSHLCQFLHLTYFPLLLCVPLAAKQQCQYYWQACHWRVSENKQTSLSKRNGRKGGKPSRKDRGSDFHKVTEFQSQIEIGIYLGKSFFFFPDFYFETLPSLPQCQHFAQLQHINSRKFLLALSTELFQISPVMHTQVCVCVRVYGCAHVHRSIIFNMRKQQFIDFLQQLAQGHQAIRQNNQFLNSMLLSVHQP